MPSNVIVPSGDYVEYEGLYTVQNNGSFEYSSGSAGALVAGNKISLYPGFKARDGSTVWGMIDSNGNSISDRLEEIDSDNDGLFDALENAMGTSNNQGIIGFETDGDGDGIPDKIFDVASAGTASQYGPGTFIGYNSKISTSYYAYSASFSISTSFGSGFVDTFLGGYSEWLDLDFAITTTYTSLLGYQYVLVFAPENNGQTYVLQAFFPGTGWVDLSNDITYAHADPSGDWTYGSPLVPSLASLPPFMRILELGKAVPAISSGDFDSLVVEALGELLPNNQLKLSLPEVLGLPDAVANSVDWAALEKQVWGDPGWNLDLDGDGVNDITLDPLNLSGKVSIPVLGKTVEITVDQNGVQTSLGKFKVKRNNNGELVVDLPGNLVGLGDHSLSLSFAPQLVKLTAFTPGSSGEPIDEEDEENPDNLVMLVNDDFDEDGGIQWLIKLQVRLVGAFNPTIPTIESIFPRTTTLLNCGSRSNAT